jgi:hypothetical protein
MPISPIVGCASIGDEGEMFESNMVVVTVQESHGSTFVFRSELDHGSRRTHDGAMWDRPERLRIDKIVFKSNTFRHLDTSIQSKLHAHPRCIWLPWVLSMRITAAYCTPGTSHHINVKILCSLRVPPLVLCMLP